MRNISKGINRIRLDRLVVAGPATARIIFARCIKQRLPTGTAVIDTLLFAIPVFPSEGTLSALAPANIKCIVIQNFTPLLFSFFNFRHKKPRAITTYIIFLQYNEKTFFSSVISHHEND